MHNAFSKSIYYSSLAKAALLAAMTLCGAAAPALAQDEVAGKFTLREDTRLGDRILPRGSYLFTIESPSTAQSVGSIPAAGSPVVFSVRPEKLAGPVAIVFAMASKNDKGLEASQLVLATGRKEATMQSLYLSEQKLLVDFDWLGTKEKVVAMAQKGRQTGASPAKATD